MEREGNFLDKEGRPANLLPAQVNQGILFLCPNQAPLFHRTRGQLHLLLLHRLNRQLHLPLRQEISSGLCYAPRFEVAPRLFYARYCCRFATVPPLAFGAPPFLFASPFAWILSQFRNGRESHRRKRHQFRSRDDELFHSLVQICQHDGSQSAGRIAEGWDPGKLLRLHQDGKFGREHDDADD